MVGGASEVELLLADGVDGLVVEKHGHFSVVEEPVGGEHGVVGLDDAGGQVGRGVDSKPILDFFL